MSRDSASLLDIVRAGELILQFAQGVSREQLESDVMRQSAILYQITIMGEATKRLSREFRSQHTEVPWDDSETFYKHHPLLLKEGDLSEEPDEGDFDKVRLGKTMNHKLAYRRRLG